MLIIVALFGLMIGSFTNVLIGRYNELESIALTRSHCPHCRNDIAWYDLVPLISFALLKARCRYCQEKISWRYPFIELLVMALAIHLYLLFGLGWLSVCYFAIFTLLIAVAFVDLDDYTIPDAYVLPALLMSFVATFLSGRLPAVEIVWGTLLAGGGLAALVVVSKERWMGSGDIGLGLIMGLLAGFYGSLVGLVVAFCVGSLVGLAAMLVKRKKLQDMIPFGPFLVLATYVATIYGNHIANWYLNFTHFY